MFRVLEIHSCPKRTLINNLSTHHQSFDSSAWLNDMHIGNGSAGLKKWMRLPSTQAMRIFKQMKSGSEHVALTPQTHLMKNHLPLF